MNIDSIENGIVIDHIQSKKGMEIYKALELDKLDCSVAIITNARSNKMGRKDIIKINRSIDLNLDILGYIDPNITINIIRDDEIIEKYHVELPKEIVNIIKCKNPRCITSTEQELDNILLQKQLYFIFDWALLPKVKFWDMCDFKILVTSDDTMRKKRILERDHISEEYLEKRESATLNYSKLSFDFTFNNDYTKESMNGFIKVIYDKIMNENI